MNKVLTYWSSILLGIILFLTVFGPALNPIDPFQIQLLEKPTSPNSHNLFGTDLLGRDIFSRILEGAKYSLGIGFLASFFSITLGCVIGMISGFMRKMDIIMNPIITLFMAFPYLLLSIAIASTLKPGIFSITIALICSGWANPARLIRSEVLALKEENFIQNLKGLGATKKRVIFSHLFPNLLSTIIVLLFTQCSIAILAESSLSFIGLGLQPPTPSWGKMIYEGTSYLRIAPWWSFFPGLILTITILSLNHLGDQFRTKLHVEIK